jgi:hypothetical protein
MSHALIDTNHDGSSDINELAGFLGFDEGGGARDGVRGGDWGWQGERGKVLERARKEVKEEDEVDARFF